jgi:signal transduction histidine kinase/CheY-like chemotaxis protein/HPt (histidine-containing phosphotransfer) domain-containing protein
MRLQQKILLIILPLILIPIIVLGVFAYKYSLNAQDKLEDVKLKSDIKYRVNQVNLYINDIESAVKFLASNKQFSDTLSNQITDDAVNNVKAEFRKFAQVYPETSQLTLINDRGEELPQCLVKDSTPVLNNKLPLLKKLQWQLITPLNGGSPLIGIQQPILRLDNNNKTHILGFVNVIFTPRWEDKLKLIKDNGDKFMISDLAGNLLFSYPEGEMGSKIPRDIFRKLHDVTRYNQSVTFKLGSNQIFFSGQKMSEKYLFLYGQDKKYVIESKTEISLITFVIVLFSIVITSSLVYYSTQRLVISQIKKLADAKKKVAQGKFDIKLTTESEDEFSELFSAFNVMVRQLVVYREKERDGRLRLEYKVKERTEELQATNKALEKSNIELEKAKVTSEQASELKSAFVANMSHEIRTPLTAILGFTEQVIADSPRGSYQLDLLGRVLISGKHLLALINNVLDVSKIEADKLEVEVTQVDLFELLNDVVSLLSTQASDKKLNFMFNYTYPIPRYIRTDSTRLKQILLNLASNAIKFTKVGSIDIDVKYLADKSQLEVIVTDTGIGMTEEIAQSLFQPFMQADVSISRRFGGTGLGLVISKNLAKLLGGGITVTSEVGKGSQFVLHINVAADENELDLVLINSLMDLAQDQGQVFGFIEEQQKEAIVANVLTGRVLVAEDVEDNQYLFKLLLDSLSVEYEIVSNGEQAVEKALTDDFDLILMDMQMPIMGGVEATSLLRQAGVDVPIYALTANVMKEDLQRHLEVGCTGTIAKPIDRKEFIAIIRSALNSTKEMDYVTLPEEQLEQLKLDYISQLPEQSDLISTHLNAMDLLGLRAELHKIKGTAGSYGFLVITNLAEEIEQFCLEHKNSDLFWSDLNAHIFTLLQTIRNIIDAESKK